MPLQPVMGLQQASQQDKAALSEASSISAPPGVPARPVEASIGSRPLTSLCRLAGTAAQSCACP